MCRMLGIISKNKIDPNSLKEFRKLVNGNSLDKKQHEHGWGIGYYENGNAKLIKMKESPNALKDKEYDATMEKFKNDKIKTNLVFAHVRKTLLTDKTINKPEFSHPFSFGNIMFMHNGGIMKQGFNSDEKETDSQKMFKFLLNNKIEKIEISIKKLKEEIGNEYSSLTFLLSDGNKIFAYRDFQYYEEYYTLYYIFKKGETFAVCSEFKNKSAGFSLCFDNIVESDWKLLNNRQLLIVNKELDKEPKLISIS